MLGSLIGGRANVYLLGHSRLQCVEIVLEGAYSYGIVRKKKKTVGEIKSVYL